MQSSSNSAELHTLKLSPVLHESYCIFFVTAVSTCSDSLVPRPSHPSVCCFFYCKRQMLGREGLGTRLIRCSVC